jgi:GGDEF domain-containing protein
MALLGAQLRDSRQHVIYDGDSDRLLASWYFGLRASEEVARCERYDRPMTLLIATIDVFDRPQFESWLSEKLRSTDMVCRGGPNTFFILLVETDEASAWSVSQRVLEDFPAASFSMATIPAQLERFDALMYGLEQMPRR